MYKERSVATNEMEVPHRTTRTVSSELARCMCCGRAVVKPCVVHRTTFQHLHTRKNDCHPQLPIETGLHSPSRAVPAGVVGRGAVQDLVVYKQGGDPLLMAFQDVRHLPGLHDTLALMLDDQEERAGERWWRRLALVLHATMTSRSLEETVVRFA
jgi:hypothetical protein